MKIKKLLRDLFSVIPFAVHVSSLHTCTCVTTYGAQGLCDISNQGALTFAMLLLVA